MQLYYVRHSHNQDFQMSFFELNTYKHHRKTGVIIFTIQIKK